MKFKTIVVTKNKIYAAAAVTLCIAAAGIVVPNLIQNRDFFGIAQVEDAFSPADDYENILNEGIPMADAGEGSILKKLTGIDISDPGSVIGEYSAVIKGTTPHNEEVPENSYDNEETEPDDTAETPAPEETQPAALPDHNAVCSSVGLKINNATDYDVNLDAMCADKLAITPEDGKPLVLIMHTHTTECYSGDEMSGETERNTDENVNVIAVGNEIENVLTSYGIGVIHDKTYHDYPSYQSSYTRALSTIEGVLKENPSIQVVLDVHRDAFVYSDGSRLRVACEQNGVPTAQVMLVVGTNSMGLWHDNWRDNLTFAAKIQNSAEIMYPGLMRPVNLRTERFNGHTTRGSLILEVGSNGNTLDEAKEGGRDVARAIAAALING